LFELGVLHTLGRVRLVRPLEEWVRESLDQQGVHIAELTPAIAMDAGRIPRSTLADPVDRLLVATARQLDATLLTADTAILAHAEKAGDVRVHNARL
jgi:PIN domain nuclease of toxin-antitoxin system